ncbi:MAG: hypothetical protein Q7S04_00285 [Candidatus Moranbacteria bacterium]|nr:hypothetical protein [Candidatus Moranbacteria bacterium]
MKNIFESNAVKVEDAGNQLTQFSYFTDIDQIRKLIEETNFSTLEEYLGKSTAELDSVKPGICAKYNSLIVELKNPDLSFENFQAIMKKTFELVR